MISKTEIRKTEIRKSMQAMRKALSDEERSLASASVNEKLFSSELWQKAKSVFTFVSYNSEIDTYGIMRQALADKKRLFVPRVEGQDMFFFEINDIDKELVPGAYGIMEPNTLGQDISRAGLMIVPGLAFDSNKNRLGYGGGFYDRYLSLPNIHETVAIGFDFQLIDSVPCEANDIKMDYIITPGRML